MSPVAICRPEAVVCAGRADLLDCAHRHDREWCARPDNTLCDGCPCVRMTEVHSSRLSLRFISVAICGPWPFVNQIGHTHLSGNDCDSTAYPNRLRPYVPGRVTSHGAALDTLDFEADSAAKIGSDGLLPSGSRPPDVQSLAHRHHRGILMVRKGGLGRPTTAPNGMSKEPYRHVCSVVLT